MFVKLLRVLLLGAALSSVMSCASFLGQKSTGDVKADIVDRVPAAGNDYVSIMGRVEVGADRSVTFGFPGVTLSLQIQGKRLTSWMKSTAGQSWIEVSVNGVSTTRIEVPSQWSEVELFVTDESSEYRIDLTHLSESWHGLVSIKEFSIDNGHFLTAPSLQERKILFLGDSVTCGEAIDRAPGERKSPAWWNARKSYGMLLAEAVEAQVHLVCWGGRGLIRTWDNRTDVPMLIDFYQVAAGENESAMPWFHTQYQPDLIVIAIGTNDFTAGIPERNAFVSAYVRLLSSIRGHYPQAHIMATESVVVGGDKKAALVDYIKTAQAVLGDDRVHYVPSRQHQGDDLDFHPTQEQNKAMASELLPYVKKIMGW